MARRCPHCRRWWLGIAAQIQHEFESLAWVSGKPVPPCNFTCNNATVMGELFSDADLLARFLREPESTAKAILDLPIEFEFSTAASGAIVGSHGYPKRKLRHTLPYPNHALDQPLVATVADYRVSISILCPVARPKKAVGLSSLR